MTTAEKSTISNEGLGRNAAGSVLEMLNSAQREEKCCGREECNKENGENGENEARMTVSNQGAVSGIKDDNELSEAMRRQRQRA